MSIKHTQVNCYIWIPEELKLMAMVRGNVSVHLSDHSEIDMADKGNHTDVTNGLGSAK